MIQRGNGFIEWYSKDKGEQLDDEIITLGYPAVDYLLEDLIEWVQDLNWKIKL